MTLTRNSFCLSAGRPDMDGREGQQPGAGIHSRRATARSGPGEGPITNEGPRRNLDASIDGRGNARATHRVTLRFDEFGWQSLESEARRDRETLDDVLSRAAAYFDAERPTSRAAMLAPGFKPGERGMEREIQLEVNRDCWKGLEDEASRRGGSA